MMKATLLQMATVRKRRMSRIANVRSTNPDAMKPAISDTAIMAQPRGWPRHCHDPLVHARLLFLR